MAKEIGFRMFRVLRGLRLQGLGCSVCGGWLGFRALGFKVSSVFGI